MEVSTTTPPPPRKKGGIRVHTRGRGGDGGGHQRGREPGQMDERRSFQWTGGGVVLKSGWGITGTPQTRIGGRAEGKRGQGATEALSPLFKGIDSR